MKQQDAQESWGQLTSPYTGEHFLTLTEAFDRLTANENYRVETFDTFIGYYKEGYKVEAALTMAEMSWSDENG